MREIKYRVWDNVHKMFHYWGFLERGLFAGLPSTNTIGVEYCKEHSDQYTGLKDKNGKEIYEGDVIFWRNGYFQIKWDEEGAGFFICKNDSYWRITESRYFPIEVIGNIYEHSHLLEE